MKLKHLFENKMDILHTKYERTMEKMHDAKQDDDILKYKKLAFEFLTLYKSSQHLNHIEMLNRNSSYNGFESDFISLIENLNILESVGGQPLLNNHVITLSETGCALMRNETKVGLGFYLALERPYGEFYVLDNVDSWFEDQRNLTGCDDSDREESDINELQIYTHNVLKNVSNPVFIYWSSDTDDMSAVSIFRGIQ